MPQIIKGIVPPDDSDAIQVYTYPSPNDPARRLAIITYDYQSGPKEVTFTNLVNREEMSHEEALERARKFAEENGISRIYEEKT